MVHRDLSGGSRKSAQLIVAKPLDTVAVQLVEFFEVLQSFRIAVIVLLLASIIDDLGLLHPEGRPRIERFEEVIWRYEADFVGYRNAREQRAFSDFDEIEKAGIAITLPRLS